MSKQQNTKKLKLKSALKKPVAKPEKLDIQTTLVNQKDLARNEAGGNDLDSLLSSFSQKYTYGYVAPKPEPKAEETNVQPKDKKKKLRAEPRTAVSKSQPTPALKKSQKPQTDDNSDWSDDFEEEIVQPTKKPKVTATSVKTVSKSAAVGKKTVKKASVPVEDDNSDWSDDFEPEVTEPVKKAKASAAPIAVASKAAPVAKKVVKKAAVVDDDSDWSDDYVAEDVPAKAAPKAAPGKATKPAVVPVKKDTQAPTSTSKTADKAKEQPLKKGVKKEEKKSEKKDGKKAMGMDMGMFMSADAMLDMEYESEEDDGVERVDEFAGMYGGDSDDEEDEKTQKSKEESVKGSKGKKDSKTAVLEKQKAEVAVAKEKKVGEMKGKASAQGKVAAVAAPVKVSKTEEKLPQKVTKGKKVASAAAAASIFADAAEYNISDEEVDYAGSDDDEEDDDDEERGMVFGAFGSDSEGEEDAEEDAEEDVEEEDADLEEDVEMDEEEDGFDMDAFEGDEDMEFGEGEDEDEFEWVEEGAEDMQLVDADDDKTDNLRKVKLGGQKLDNHMTITACDAFEAALALAQPARVPDEVAGALLSSSEVGRSGLLSVLAAQLKHPHSQTDVVSKLLFLSELCRYNTVKDLSKTFHSLTDAYLRDNEFNNFEQWLLTARFTSLLTQPLPSVLPAPEVRKLIAKMLTKGKATLTKLSYASPLPVNLPVMTEEQREKLLQQQQMSMLKYAARQQLRQEHKAKSKQTLGSSATIHDSLLPQGPAVAEHLKFAQMLVSRGAAPEAAVGICENLNSKIVNNVMNIVDGGPYNTYGGDVKCEEVWSGKASEEEVLWGWPQHAKAALAKKIRLSAGKVSVTLSLLHFVKLAILYFTTLRQNKAGMGARGRPFGESEPVPCGAEYGAENNYADVGPYMAMVLQALPITSTFRTVFGDMVRVGTLTGNKFMSNFRQMARLMKIKAWYNRTNAAKTSEKSEKGEKNVPTGVVPALPDLSQFMLTDVAAQAALAANGKAAVQAPLVLPLPRHFLQAVMTTVLRYQSLQGASTKGGGNQASLTHHVFKTLQSDFGVIAECFASPLNCYFSKYCSAFPDTDAMFGSLGSFFQFTPASGSYQVNPPFDEDVILASALHIEQLLAKQAKSELPLSFVVIIPESKEQMGWKHLQTSEFCAGMVTVPARQHAYYEGLQQSRKLHHIFHAARHATSVFILQNAAAEEEWPVTEEKVQRLVESFQKPFELPQ